MPSPASHEPDVLSDSLGISRLMLLQTDLDQLLNLIMEEATRLMSAERSSLFLVNEKTGELTSFIAQEVELMAIRLPMGHGIAGTVAKTGKVINLQDAYESDLFDPTWDQKTSSPSEYGCTVLNVMPCSNSIRSTV